MFSVIIPCCNEENYIRGCLDALLSQAGLPDDHGIEVIVAANGCKDRTVQIARACEGDFTARGFALQVLDIPEPGKTGALNRAEAAARFGARVFVDADVILSEGVLAELGTLLDADTPVYASATVTIPTPRSAISRAYARVWTNLPFVRDGVPGIGLYAVNAPARSRWGAFPPIYSDDRFVRMNFAPHERRKARASYRWPLPEGLRNLIRVRRRWTEGNRELVKKYPQLMVNESERNKTPANLLALLATPLASTAFVSVYVASELLARLPRRRTGFHWRRGRA
ncbi:glycosyltransferase [Rhodobaculum claviforme]|uniref:glycosyltransferase n=1 Tax=Rhodobaculum claviforme TaxID=1549854 RepID=UPI0019115B7A